MGCTLVHNNTGHTMVANKTDANIWMDGRQAPPPRCQL